MIIHIASIVIGLVVLVLGAEALVRGAASIASKFRISPLIIGLTVVAFGTSAPELTVNMVSALKGNPDIAIGNVVGSSIANILLILGVCALFTPLRVKSSTVWKEIPFAFLGAVLLLIMGNDQILDGVRFNALTRTDGITFMCFMGLFMYYIVGQARSDRTKETAEVSADEQEEIKVYSTLTSSGLLLAGLVGLVVGGQMLVNGAIAVASAAGLSDSLIGLTIVAIGTSLPELATSLVAALKKQADIAIGNVVGSNIFNMFWILGLTGTILQLPFNAASNFDIIIMIGSTALLFAFMFTGKKHLLTRREGILFLMFYITYIGILIDRG